MDYEVEFKPNPKVERGLKEIPDDILYSIARQTLDMSVNIIPKSVGQATSGKLRRTSLSGGVRGSHQDYYIGSYTNYAVHVWNMNDATTNWTTPNTHSQWYTRTLKKNGQTIINNAITRSWKEKM